jgi:hypothetical protein
LVESVRKKIKGIAADIDQKGESSGIWKVNLLESRSMMNIRILL